MFSVPFIQYRVTRSLESIPGESVAGVETDHNTHNLEIPVSVHVFGLGDETRIPGGNP